MAVSKPSVRRDKKRKYPLPCSDGEGCSASSEDLNQSYDSTSCAESSSQESSEDKSSSLQNQNVKVVARLRPLSGKETREKSTEAIKALTSIASLEIHGTSTPNRKFELDAVFGTNSTQKEVYEGSAGDLVRSNIYKGFNVTILAYGQTGSGKTFTMGTEGGDFDPDTEETSPKDSDGVIPRAVHDLFSTKSTVPNHASRVSISMSYLEIYNEECRDLLSSHSDHNKEVHIREGRNGVIVQNLSTVSVHSPLEVRKFMQEASSKRATASTAMNAVSSRSHAICTLYVCINPQSEDDEKISAKLTLVDLAGSERIKRTGAEGARMKEGININKGLFVLGQVVSALSELGQQEGNPNSAAHHIPYRDSKLTRLLQDSLGGNSKTVMLACVSPADSNVDESTNTLRYAERTRSIKNSAVRNVVATGLSPVEAAALRRENQMLKLQLMQLQMKIGPSGVTSVITRVITEKVVTADGGVPVTIPQSTTSCVEASCVEGINPEKLEIVTRLRAENSSLENKIERLESRISSGSEDVLTASLRADHWQHKYEQLCSVTKHGPIENTDCDILTKQRKQIEELKGRIQEKEDDAEVARTFAAAIVAGNGDLTEFEEMALASSNSDEVDDTCKTAAREFSESNEDNSQEIDNKPSEKLTSELVSISDGIEQKEKMAEQMNKEREGFESIRSHFECAMTSLQEEVEVLNSERTTLLIKLDQQQTTKTNNTNKRKSCKGNVKDPTTQKRIKELETRISELKRKTSEHAKALKLRAIAEKKCAALAAEIVTDKKRRATLQKKLREEAGDRRKEKKSAQLNAAKMLRDSQKLRYELSKVKDNAAKQAAVLRRKANEAIQKQKAAMELQKRKLNASAMRAGRMEYGTGAAAGSAGAKRREDILKWFDKEIESVSCLMECKQQITEHNELLQEAESRKEGLIDSSQEDHRTELRTIDHEIDARKSIIQQLEKNITCVHKSVGDGCTYHPVSSSNSIFVDTMTYQALSRPELRFIFTQSFDKVLSYKKSSENLKAKVDEKIESGIQEALMVVSRKHEEATVKLKMSHSETMMNLLESTNSAVEQKFMTRLGADIVDKDTKETVDSMLKSYFDGCKNVGESVSKELQQVKEKHEGMTQMVGKIASDIISQNEAVAIAAMKKKKKKKPRRYSYIEEKEYFGEETLDEQDCSDDSDWDPRNGKADQVSVVKKKRRKEGNKDDGMEGNELEGEKIIAKEEQPINVAVLNAPINEKMKVADIKQLLRAKGLAVSGKKAELLGRLRQSLTTVLEDSIPEDSVLDETLNDGNEFTHPEMFACEDQTNEKHVSDKKHRQKSKSRRSRRLSSPDAEFFHEDCEVSIRKNAIKPPPKTPKARSSTTNKYESKENCSPNLVMPPKPPNLMRNSTPHSSRKPLSFINGRTTASAIKPRRFHRKGDLSSGRTSIEQIKTKKIVSGNLTKMEKAGMSVVKKRRPPGVLSSGAKRRRNMMADLSKTLSQAESTL